MKKKNGKTGDTDDDVKKDDEEQSQRFFEIAKEVDAEDSIERLEDAMKSIDKDLKEK